jgi:acyl-CoA synthetase (AMP-forming)/AMP-acid ligase II
MTLGQTLQLRTQRQPAQVAVYLQHAGQPDKPLRFADLWRGAQQFARCYRKRGLKPGDVVILILQHGEDLVFGFWGAIVCGVIPSIMPFLTEKLSPEQYRNDLKALIAVTAPAALVTYPQFEQQALEAIAGTAPAPQLISTAEVRSQAEVHTSVDELAKTGQDDIVLLQHSSGTTGLQKGVALSHRAVLNQVEAYKEALSLTSEDVIVSWLPLYHDMGLIAGFLLPILEGVPLVLSSPFDWVRAPWRQLRTISEYGGTISWLPNFAYNFMAEKVRDRELDGVDLGSWRAVINCSEPVRWGSHKAFFERFEKFKLRRGALQTCYAMAENVFAVTQSDLGREPAVLDLDREYFLEKQVAERAGAGRQVLQVMSSGRALKNTRLRVLDAKGVTLPDGKIGEIALESDCMLTGYYRRPDADKAAFQNGWYLTGDLGFISDGELYVAGRKKDLIIVGGKNIYPQDIEALSYEVPGIHAGRSVAFGVFNEKLGTEDVCLVAETDNGDAARLERLADEVRQHVTRNSAVALRHVRVVGPKWILKTSSGKTARAANRDKFLRELTASADTQHREGPLL